MIETIEKTLELLKAELVKERQLSDSKTVKIQEYQEIIERANGKAKR